MTDLFKRIEPVDITDNPFKAIDKDWMLITAGHAENHKTFNTMTASWGAWGILWHKPVAFCFVRPTRYTYEFTEKNEFFTLSFFEESFRDALNLCGTKSGKDTDKVAQAGLTPLALDEYGHPGTVTFKEARLVVVCKKLYYGDLDPKLFLDPGIEKNYPKKDYHRMYIGEILGVYTR
jgi:flavin reductase (DIM6/NTAB) family NADH-FMN oxidoreductase RutF